MSVLIAVYAAAMTYLYSESLLRDIDRDLAETAAVVAQYISPDVSGTFDLNFPPGLRNTLFTQPGGTYYIVWNPRGEVIDRSEFAPVNLEMLGPGTGTIEEGRYVVAPGPAATRILAGRALGDRDVAVRSLGLAIAGAGGTILLLSLAGGWFLASRALAPVARISGTAAAMVAGDLEARIPIVGTDSELEQLARALNEAFDRMRAATETQRRFIADASHELRTPLATLRAELDWAMKRPRTMAEYETSIAKASLAADRLTYIAGSLLTLAAPGGGAPALSRECLNLATLVREVADLLRPLAESRGIVLSVTGEAVWTRGDSGRLTDALSNVIKNAIEYNRSLGTVTVVTRREGEQAVVIVRDTGIGIAAGDLPHIFERFYRAGAARSRAGGAGLGLAIARAVVEEHGGAITCTSAVDAGSEFIIRLPAVGG
ncbi:MAG: HAMP domain-containing protein [Acidobacteria bacterium]|nr:HAMP domain-containing protein [Acidobacteriota bacterium]